MVRAFVIRPFHIKKDSAGNAIDFDRVHEQLIQPALVAFWDGREEGVGPGGTAHVVQLARMAGNVHIARIDSNAIQSSAAGSH